MNYFLLRSRKSIGCEAFLLALLFRITLEQQQKKKRRRRDPIVTPRAEITHEMFYYMVYIYIYTSFGSGLYRINQRKARGRGKEADVPHWSTDFLSFACSV